MMVEIRCPLYSIKQISVQFQETGLLLTQSRHLRLATSPRYLLAPTLVPMTVSGAPRVMAYNLMYASTWINKKRKVLWTF